jgi:hypothetical protein
MSVKNAEFDAYSKLIEKVAKKFYKKLLSLKSIGFFIFWICVQKFLAL